MATTYPATKQTFTDPTSTSKLNSPSHSSLHTDMNDTVEAIEDKLGTTGSLISGCGGLYPGSDSATAIQLCKADGTTPIVIVDTSNAYVGIGTGSNSLAHTFTIQVTDGQLCAMERHSANASAPILRMYKSRGTAASPSVLSDADRTGQLEFWGYARNNADDDNEYVRTGYIRHFVDGLDAQGRIGGKIGFFTSSGVSINPSEKLSVDNQSITIHNISTATAGSQYDSWDLKFKCSVWDTDNVQAEDRTVTMVLDAGSGADGSEPYKLQWKANDGGVIMELDCTTDGAERLNIVDSLGRYGDPNTTILFPSNDRISFYAGGACFFDLQETTQDNLYIGNGALGTGEDIDIFMGTNNAVTINGETGNLSLTTTVSFTKTGTVQIFTYEGEVADDGTFDLPDATAGMGMISFDEGAEYAFFSFTDAAAVTLISNTANVVNTQTDGKYCIFDNGTAVRVENKIGSAKNIKCFVWCN